MGKMVYFPVGLPEGTVPVQLTATEFEDLVVAALDSLPEDLLELFDNVDITVEHAPTQRQLQSAGIRHGTLLGLYEGIPLTARSSTGYTLVMPDKITIFQ